MVLSPQEGATLQAILALVALGPWGMGACAQIAGVEDGVLGASGAGAVRSAYAAAILADGPVAYWRLGEEVPPVAVDTSGHGHDGTYTAATLGAPGAIAGDPDTATQFDGQGHVLVEGAFRFEGAAPFVVEFWANPVGDVGASFIAASKHTDQEGFMGWFVCEHPVGQLQFHHQGAWASTTSLERGRYTHVAGMFDGATIALFVNGEKAATAGFTAPIPPHDGPLRIGRVPGWGWYSGTLDEVAVFDKVLSETRIRAHYRIGIGQTP